MKTSKLFLLFIALTFFTGLYAQPDQLRDVRIIEAAEGGYNRGRLLKHPTDNSYTMEIHTYGSDTIDAGIWDENLLEEPNYEQVLWHLNYDENLVMSSYYTEILPTAFNQGSLPNLFQNFAKRDNGEFAYFTQSYQVFPNTYEKFTNPEITTSITEFNQQSNIVVFQPIENQLTGKFCTSRQFGIQPTPFSHYARQAGLSWGHVDIVQKQKASLINDSLIVSGVGFTVEHLVNDEYQYVGVENQAGYLHSILNLNSGDLETFPVISEQGNFGLEYLTQSNEPSMLYKIGSVRGNETTIAVDGTQSISQPGDSLYRLVLVKESYEGEVAWFQELFAYNNSFEDSAATPGTSMRARIHDYELIEKDDNLFLNYQKVFEVHEEDTFWYTDFFGNQVEHVPPAPWWTVNEAFTVVPVYAERAICAMTTAGEKLVKISRLADLWTKPSISKELFTVMDRLAWVETYRALSDTTITYQRVDNQGMVAETNIDIPAGEGAYVLWMNQDLEIENHWLFEANHCFRIDYVGMHGSDSLIVQGSYGNQLDETIIDLDPADIQDDVSIPAGALFLAIYDWGMIDAVDVRSEVEYEVHVYPNPAEDLVQVEANITAKGTYSIIDVSGRIAQKGILSVGGTHTIDIKTLDAGVYLLKIENGNASAVRKLKVH